MEPKESDTGVDLSELQNTCKLQPKRNPSTSFILKKNLLSQDSISDISTIEYLNKFRRKTGFEDPLKEREAKLPEAEPNEPSEIPPTFNFSAELSSFSDESVAAPPEAHCREHTPTDSDEPGFEEADDLFKSTSPTVKLNAQQLENLSLVAGICRVTSLDVSNICITSVQTVGCILYLQRINASKNLVQTFLDITRPPIALKDVDFSYNKIGSIVNLQKFWSLTDINLSHNELTKVEGFSDLEFLQILNLSYNKIDEIMDLTCPNLLTLYLNHNCLESITDSIKCGALHYLNLCGNKLSEVKGFKYLPKLTELIVAENNIVDISELEHFKPLLYLTRVMIEPNPITTLENWRLVLIHMLPQVLWLDGRLLEPTELRASANLFNPSFKKLAFLDHAAILHDKVCQSANTIFDDYCRNRPLPPLLLLVGAPRSHCHTLALLLKQKFRNKVYLGGVHSTATTMEGSNPKVDIPVSYESFKEKKNRGEFLATSQILGRVCGFATSQIARAAEKGALLVAAVPLTTAISLRQMDFKPKLVLALPTSPPEFPVNEERIETLRRSIEKPERKSDKRSQNNIEVTMEGHEHLVKFGGTFSAVAPTPSKILELDVSSFEYKDPREPSFIDGPQHSILKTPHFEVKAPELSSFTDFEDKSGLPQRLESRVRLRSSEGADIDMERKTKQRLKSLAPGMERYHYSDDNDDGDEVGETEIKDKPHKRASQTFQEKKQIQKNSADLPTTDAKILKTKIRKHKKVCSARVKDLKPGQHTRFRNSDPEAEGKYDDESISQALRSKVRLIPSTDSVNVGMESKTKQRLKSLAPGMERYNFSDDDDDDDLEEGSCTNSDDENEILEDAGNDAGQSSARRKSQRVSGDQIQFEDANMLSNKMDGTESEVDVVEEEKDARPSLPTLSHKEAMTFSILQTRDKYAQFHYDNPGFFHTVIDTCDMCESYKTIENIALEALIKYKKEMNENTLNSFTKSYAGGNQDDEEQFLALRMQHFKNCSAVWSKGIDGLHVISDRQLKATEDEPSQNVFNNVLPPGSLLNATIPRPPATLKMKKLAEIYEKRARFSKPNFE